jgi:aspartate/tyrosine/aromatic aminotransferase
MLSSLPQAPPDSILGLSEAFQQDPSPRKINLSVGVYKDERGKTPILASVKEAERRLLESESSKGYLAIEGHPQYAARVQELLFGGEHEVLTSRRGVTAQTPGGTGALRVAADLVKKHFPMARVWVSAPTWANHPAIFRAAGMEVETYPYIDAQGRGLNFHDMLYAVKQIPAGDVVRAARLLPQSLGNRPGPRTVEGDWRCACRWRAVAADRFRLPGLWHGAVRRRGCRSRTRPAGTGALGVQLVLQELRPLRRAGRGADGCDHRRRCSPAGSQPDAPGNSHEL